MKRPAIARVNAEAESEPYAGPFAYVVTLHPEAPACDTHYKETVNGFVAKRTRGAYSKDYCEVCDARATWLAGMAKRKAGSIPKLLAEIESAQAGKLPKFKPNRGRLFPCDRVTDKATARYLEACGIAKAGAFTPPGNWRTTKGDGQRWACGCATWWVEKHVGAGDYAKVGKAEPCTRHLPAMDWATWEAREAQAEAETKALAASVELLGQPVAVVSRDIAEALGMTEMPNVVVLHQDECPECHADETRGHVAGCSLVEPSAAEPRANEELEVVDWSELL